MNNMGMPEFDWALTIACFLALGVNCHYLPSRCAQSPAIGFITIFRLVGWLLLTGRFAYVMFVYGDILIPFASWLGIMLLALGEIAVMTNKGRTVKL